MNLIDIFSIIIIHFITDFIFQDEKWALGKSKNLNDLTTHTTVYSVLWWFPMSIMLNDFTLAVLFVIVTFIIHTITDYFTSKIVSKKFIKESIFTLTIDKLVYNKGDILNKDDDFGFIVMDKIEPSFANKYSYKIKRYNPIPNLGAFTMIGLDQVLHYIQLFTTYYLLTKI